MKFVVSVLSFLFIDNTIIISGYNPPSIISVAKVQISLFSTKYSIKD